MVLIPEPPPPLRLTRERVLYLAVGLAFGALCVIARTRFSVPILYHLAGVGGLAVALQVYGALMVLWARHYPVVHEPLFWLHERCTRPPAPGVPWWRERRVVVVLALYLLVFVFHLGQAPDWDPASYLVNGKMMAAGQALYAESWCNKFPGVATVTWLAAVLGPGAWGQYYLATLLAFVSSSVAFLLLGQAAQRAWGGSAGFLVVALASGFYLLTPDMVVAEPFLVPFLALAFVSVVRFLASERGSLRSLALGGAAYGLALTFKQPGAIYGPAIVGCLVLVGAARGSPWRALQAGAVFTLGCWSVLGLVAAILALSGVWTPFVEHTILYWLYHAPGGGFAPAGRLETLGRIFASTAGSRTGWALASVGLVVALRERSALLLVAAGWLGLGLVDVYAQITQNHSAKYLLTVALPAALLGARALSLVLRRRAESFDAKTLRAALVAVVALGWLGGLITLAYRAAAEDSSWQDEVVTPALQAGTYVREHAPPGASLYVVGAHPVAYLAAERLPTTRFWGILEVPEWADLFGYREVIEAQLREPPADYLVLGGVWDRELFEEALPWFEAHVRARYRLAHRYGGVEVYALR